MTTPDPAQNEPQTPPEGDPAAAKPQTLEEMLADLDDDRRNAVLGQVTKARSEAKSLRERLKAAEPKAQQFDSLQAAQQTAEQRAAAAAEEAQKRAVTAMQKAARTTVKTALSGVVDDPESIIDDLNIAKFVTDDGEIDEDAVTALRDRYAALGGGTRRAPRPDPTQASGANGAAKTDPRTEFASIFQGALNR